VGRYRQILRCPIARAMRCTSTSMAVYIRTRPSRRRQGMSEVHTDTGPGNPRVLRAWELRLMANGHINASCASCAPPRATCRRPSERARRVTASGGAGHGPRMLLWVLGLLRAVVHSPRLPMGFEQKDGRPPTTGPRQVRAPGTEMVHARQETCVKVPSS